MLNWNPLTLRDCFMVLTFLSIAPFEAGWYGAHRICLVPFCLKKQGKFHGNNIMDNICIVVFLRFPDVTKQNGYTSVGTLYREPLGVIVVCNDILKASCLPPFYKWDTLFAAVLRWVRCCSSFSLLH